MDVSTTAAAAEAQDTEPGALRRMIRNIDAVKHELAKFSVVGVASYGLDSAVFLSCRVALGEPLIAKIIAGVISATAAFVGNRYWTWSHRARSSLGREYFTFLVINAIGLSVQLGCIAFTHYGLGRIWPFFSTVLADFLSQGVFGMGLATAFRFWAYRRFVFLETTPATGTTEPPHTVVEPLETVTASHADLLVSTSDRRVSGTDVRIAERGVAGEV